jgi:hypothetical protein
MAVHSLAEDYPKPRLLTHFEIAKAIMKLVEEGVPADELLPTMTRSYYVDLDTFNQLLASDSF